MEVVVQRRGRAYAARGGVRPVTVHIRTVPALMEGQRERVRTAAGCAATFALMLFAGLLEGSTWPN